MGKYETNKQWTTYRILDATIGFADMSSPFNWGSDTAGHDVKLFGATTSAYVHWDSSLDTLYMNTMELKMYHSTLHIGPGQVNQKLQFYDANNFIQAVGPGSLQIGASSTIDMMSRVVHHTYLQLFVTAVDSTVAGQLYLSTGSELRWGHGAITFQALHINAAGGGICSVPGGMTLTGKLTLGTSNVTSTAVGEMYIRTADSTLRWGHGAIEFRALHASGADLICTFPGHVRVNVDDDSSTTTAGEMWLQSTNSKLRWGHGAIVMESIAVNVANKRIECESFLILHTQSGVGGVTTKGEIFLNTDNNKLYFYDGTSAKLITSA